MRMPSLSDQNFRSPLQLVEAVSFEETYEAIFCGSEGDGCGGFGVGDGGGGEFALERLEGAAEFGDAGVGALAHRLEGGGVLWIGGEVYEFAGIVLEVVEKLVVIFVDVADVFKLLGAQAFEGGDAVADGEVFVEGLGAPILRCLSDDDGGEAVPLIALGNFCAGPIEEGGGEVEIEGEGFGDFAAFALEGSGGRRR